MSDFDRRECEKWFRKACAYAELFGFIEAVVDGDDDLSAWKVELVRAKIAEFKAKERRTDEPDGSQP